MDTPRSPSNQSQQQPQPQQPPNPIPLTSPLRTHPKPGLPPTFSSTYPHGHISGHPRSPSLQAAFLARKAEILRTMTRGDIEKAYEGVVARVREQVDGAERRGREVEGEIEKLVMEREMERRVWGKLRGLREGAG